MENALPNEKQYISALDAMKEVNLPSDVFTTLLQHHEKELSVHKNDDERNWKAALKNWDFRLSGWNSLKNEFYSKELKTPEKYLYLFKLFRPQWEQFKIQHKNEISFGQEERKKTSEDIDKDIAAWNEILPMLNGANLIAAKLAILKIQGMTHEAAFRELFPEKTITKQRAKEYVSKKYCNAKIIVEKFKQYNLSLPNWRTREN